MAYFTVCIPAYNREYTLKRCLDSLCNQTMKDFEVVFVDDGSTDNTKKLVEEYRKRLYIRYYYKENGGKHTALNVGIKNAGDTELFLILDSDDWLKTDALEKFRSTWESIERKQKEQLCGVAGKYENQNGKLLGTKFPKSPYIFSYIDMHFRGTNYGDCCECTKTELIKQYSYPEPQNTKFVPEYYIYDQIGLKYSLFCINEVIGCKEYMEDGITRNIKDFFEKNCVGYSCGLVCRIEKVFSKNKKIPMKAKVITWYEYWKALYFDESQSCAHVESVDIYGFLGKVLFYIKIVMVKLKLKERI